jgi:hypothetical protein
MKVKYDENNFVWGIANNDNSFELVGGYSEMIMDDVYLGDIFEPGYGYPLYKMIDPDIILITDPTEYQVSTRIWRLYLSKVRNDMFNLIESKTNQELAILYAALPALHKPIFYTCLEEYWSREIPQYTMNTALEMMIRYNTKILKMLYDAYDKQNMNADLKASFDRFFAMFDAHDAVMQPPLTANTWILNTLESLLIEADHLRFDIAIPARIEIIGQ